MKKKIVISIILVLLIITTNVSAATSKVILTFDDGWTNVYNKAYPIMKNNSQQGVVFLITGTVNGGSGTNGWADMNLAQAKDLYSKGWDVSSHTVTHPYLTKLNSVDLNAELANSKLWLNNAGFIRSSSYLAYPYGDYNDNVLTAVKNNGYTIGRTVVDTQPLSGQFPQHKLSDLDIYEINTLMVYSKAAYGSPATPPQFIENMINDTISKNGLLVMSLHDIEDTVTSGDAPEVYKTSDFKIISDFIKTKVNKGEIDAVTFSQYFGSSPSPLPSPSPSPTPIVSPSPTPIVSPSPTPIVSPSPTPIVSPPPTPIVSPPPTPIVSPPPTPIVSPPPTPITTTVKINVNADTYTSASAPTKNYGTSTYIYMDSGRRGYFKYDIISIPSSAIILNAELHDVISWSQATGTAKMFAVTNTWTETGLTWNSQPTNESTSFGTYNIPICNSSNGDCVHTVIGIENIIQRWINGTLINNGFMITTPTIITNSEFSAKESGNIPYLLITYTTGGLPTPSPTPSPVPTTSPSPSPSSSPVPTISPSPSPSPSPVPTVTPMPTPIPGSTTYISHIKRNNGFYKVDGQTNASVINIHTGDKVQWINDGANTITLMSSQNLWTGKSLATGVTYIYTFNNIGNYKVYLKGYTNKNQMIKVT